MRSLAPKAACQMSPNPLQQKSPCLAEQPAGYSVALPVQALILLFF